MDEGLELANIMLTDLEKISLTKVAIEKAYKDSVYQFYKTAFLREHVHAFMEEGITPHSELLDYHQSKLMTKATNRVNTKPPYALVTINPRPDETYESLKKLVEKYIEKKYIASYFYVYEVRKSDHSGLHCHILLNYTCRPYDLKRNTKALFKSICDSNNPCILNIKYIEESILPEKIEYMLGNKKDSKQLGVEFTKAYREQNKIAVYYESLPALPCRVTHAEIKN